MTTPTTTSSNKTALRASLKKEDDSLADRLVAADAPLVATPETEAPDVAVPESAPVATPAPKVAARSTRSAARPAAAVKADQPTPAAAPAARARPVRSKAAAPAQEGPLEQLAKLEKVVKQKRDKLVRYSVDLLKSEEAAIDALRDELARAAGWVASKSDIVRAGIRVFAEQKLEQMQDLLGSPATTAKSKGGTPGTKGKKGRKGKKKG